MEETGCRVMTGTAPFAAVQRHIVDLKDGMPISKITTISNTISLIAKVLLDQAESAPFELSTGSAGY
jgi:hypothetical protein